MLENNKHGVFVTLEGSDGAGKTSNVSFIAECLREYGFRILTTREPGGTPVAEQLRHLVLHEHMTDDAELLIFAAARADHIATVIKPAMAEGTVVLSDRFHDSTIAYQGWGRKLLSKVHELDKFVRQGFEPDHTLFFDIPFEECLNRLSKRSDKQDRIDQEAIDFKKRVWEGYQNCFNSNRHRMVRIDALNDPEHVREQLRRWVHEKFTPKYEHLRHFPR